MPETPQESPPEVKPSNRGVKVAVAGGGTATITAVAVALVQCWESSQANKKAILNTEIHYVTVEDWNAGRKSDLEQVVRLLQMREGTNR